MYSLFVNGAPDTSYVYAYNWDTNEDYVAHALAGTATATLESTVSVVEWRHLSGNLGVRYNGGSWQTTASGNTGDLTDILLVGSNFDGARYQAMNMFELVLFSAYPGDSPADALVANMLGHYA